MGLLDTLRSFVSREERNFEYHCTNCHTEFESPKADMSDVSCPECSSTQVRSRKMMA